LCIQELKKAITCITNSAGILIKKSKLSQNVRKNLQNFISKTHSMITYFDEKSKKNFKKRSFIRIKIYPRFKGIRSTLFRKIQRTQSILHPRVRKGYYLYNQCSRYSKRKIKVKAKYLEKSFLKSNIWLKKDFLIGVVIWRVLVSPEIKSLIELIFQIFFY
jgi:excinuclease UvrABC ATPase subunit